MSSAVSSVAPTAELTTPPRRVLPPDDAQRRVLHNEVHARPPARIRLPALVVYVAVLNEGITREMEWQHLRQLPGQEGLTLEHLSGNFQRLRFANHTLKWERHTEFTRYSIVQALPDGALVHGDDEELIRALVVDPAWLAAIPGRTVAAIMMAMVHGDVDDLMGMKTTGEPWIEGRETMASLLGIRRSCVMTDFRLRPSGFERLLVISPADTSELRVGRISQRLLELETYRLMALRGLPVAKDLGPVLTRAESQLAEIMARMENAETSDQELLGILIGLAARIERATATHMYRFSATMAYHSLVEQRIEQLRETPIPGTQTVGEFMLRRLSPAIATVQATSQRLSSLSQRVERASALLRTRVDIATESQNQMLLEKLTKGQDLQLRLQSTVEGLSIAAIAYYVVSLILYVGKAGKAAGLPVNPEILAGALIPLVLMGVWWGTRQIHKKLKHSDDH
ncbi:MAG: hypothetical protein A3G29_18370 [Burkholderiales bacterium RIFCSPLOWO2_12_FULL_64_99]|nr:MAG: hypothetical protein A3E52_08925 [Burkholderiales bacterium RIFCSPHIGHO2_12_FULL_63_20]OGB60911.1 MAG: hypothetical protein A3G29_18370 [Burkholderiales bacterium RIFCSPLOWO2_12_FULL_64_99]